MGKAKTQKASKDSRKAHGAEKKGDLLFIDPDKLTLVTDPHSDLYDKRVHEEPTERFILNVMHYGVTEPITVRKNPETGETEVVKGRHRVKGLREANKRLRARGDEPHLIPCVVKRMAKGAHAIGLILTENEQRHADSATNRAEKAARMIDHGGTPEDVGIALGVDVATVKGLLALHDAPDFVRHAVDAEKVTLTNGIKAAKLAAKDGPDAGRKLIKRLVTEAPRTPGKKRSTNSRKAREIVDGAPVMRSKKEIAEMKASLTQADPSDPRAEAIGKALAWVLGESNELEFPRAQLALAANAPAAAQVG
jgi:ParB family chromosome partitioning protein